MFPDLHLVVVVPWLVPRADEGGPDVPACRLPPPPIRPAVAAAPCAFRAAAPGGAEAARLRPLRGDLGGGGGRGAGQRGRPRRPAGPRPDRRRFRGL